MFECFAPRPIPTAASPIALDNPLIDDCAASDEDPFTSATLPN